MSPSCPGRAGVLSRGLVWGVPTGVLALSITALFSLGSKEVFVADRVVFGDVGTLPNAALLARELREDRALQTLSNIPEIRDFILDGRNSIEPISEELGVNFQTLRFRHYFDGIEVIGSSVLHHSGEDPDSAFEVSNHLRQFDLDIRPDLDEMDVLTLATDYLKDRTFLERPSLKVLAPSFLSRQPLLVYWVSVSEEDYRPGLDLLFNAKTGDLVAEIPRQHSLAPIDVYDASRTPDKDINPLTGAPLRLDPKYLDLVVSQSKVKATADASAKRAFRHCNKTLKYFKETHQQDSYDNKGSGITSIVHIGRKWGNAFWDNSLKLMAFGDGNGVTTRDMTLAVDVTAHELTHGVVAHTAELLYLGESGAINEGLADFFGKMVENKDDWVMGRELSISGKGTRNLADPSKLSARYLNEKGKFVYRAYPERPSEKFTLPKGQSCSRANDHCYVHANSTVVSHAAYAVTQVLGKERSEKLFFHTLKHRLTRTSGFPEFKVGTLKSCQRLYTKWTCQKVEEAFEDLGF